MLASSYPRFSHDGSGRFVQSLAEAVADLGHEVHVLAPFHPRQAPADSPVHLHRFRYIWPDSAAIMGYAGAMNSDRHLRAPAYALIAPYLAFGSLALRRLMSQYHFDVIHAHWVLPGGLLALPFVSRQSPLVISLHGSDVFVALRNPVFGAIARQVFKRARLVTACSPELSEGALQLGAPAASTHLIPWGADPQVFAGERDVAGLRQRLQLAPDAQVILTIGRLVAKKGCEYLVRAMPAILRAVPSARLVIVGDGPERPHLEKVAVDVGARQSVVFTGMVSWDMVPAYLQLAEVFVVPSTHDEAGNVDGLPTTILEAMAAGKSIVASRVAGIPLVVRDGETGILVDERQPAQLAEGVIRLLTQPGLSRRLGSTARRDVETHLNWNQVARQFVELYQQSWTRAASGLSAVG